MVHHDGIFARGGRLTVRSLLTANAELVITIVKIALLLFIVLTVNAYLTWFERKVVAHIQSRWGPHRVGPHGLLQPMADGLKFLFKEDPTPAGVDKFVYYLAPLLALALALTSIAIIPFGPEPLHVLGHDIYLGIAPLNLNIGILALFAITALGVYGVALAGWSSNSKYPLLGGLRSSAQMVSYELALTMSVVGVLLMAGSFNLRDIINAQARHPEWGVFGWNLWPQILGFFCFFTAAVAETNRVPFDLPEAESELVAGFHTEYASFKFAMFFIAEYTSMITVVPLHHHVFRRMALSLPCFLDRHALSAVRNSDSVRLMGHHGRLPLRDSFRPSPPPRRRRGAHRARLGSHRGSSSNQ